MNSNILKFDNIYSIYLNVKPSYNEEIEKVKSGDTILSSTINQIDSIRENIDKSIMNRYNY